MAVNTLYAPVNTSQTEWLQGQMASFKKLKKSLLGADAEKRVYRFVPQLNSVKPLGEKVSL